MPEEVPSRAREGPAAGDDAPGVEAEAEPARTADAREPADAFPSASGTEEPQIAKSSSLSGVEVGTAAYLASLEAACSLKGPDLPPPPPSSFASLNSKPSPR